MAPEWTYRRTALPPSVRSMLLKDRVAVIYGGGGGVGGAVARAFAREGARLYLAGRTRAPLEIVGAAIRKGGGTADAATLDALDVDAVEAHAARVVDEAGRIDISLNVIGYGDTQGEPLLAMKPDRFVDAIHTAMESHFVTATAVGRHMVREGSGVILALSAQAGRLPYLNTGGFGVLSAAIEAFCRQLAAELGPGGIRVVCLRSGGSPETPAGQPKQEWWAKQAEKTALRRLPLLADVANAAVLMASDRAAAITAEIVNVTSGELYD